MGRIDKVNQQVKREVGLIIQKDLSDPRLEFVSITAADVSPDLHNAKIFFSVLGNPQSATDADKALESAGGYIRRLVSQRMNMRYTPELHFIYDDTIEKGMRIEEALKEIQDDQDEPAQGD